MQARYYDPVLGRFYSNDPVDAASFISKGQLQGFNGYTYTFNNPYKYIDPDGRSPLAYQTMYNARNEMNSENAAIAKGKYISEQQRKTLSSATDSISKVTATAAVFFFGNAGNCPLAAPLTAVSGVSGLVSSVTDDNPAEALTAEALTLGAGKKLEAIGELAKGAGKLSDVQLDTIVNAVEVVTGDIIKEELVEINE